MSSSQPGDSDQWSGLSDHDNDDDASRSSAEPPNAFLDIEASEADSDQLQSEDGFTEEEEDDLRSFRFMDMPMELREMVWRHFCPDLSGKPRVFQLILIGRLSCASSMQSVPMRTVMAVHHESRQLALNVSPDLIEFENEQTPVPCNFQKDVILIQFDPLLEISDDELGLIDDSLSKFRNIGLYLDVFEYSTWFPSFMNLFEDLENIFIVEDSEDEPDKALAWCVSDKVHEYTYAFEQSYLGDDEEATFIWPDVYKHRAAAHREFSTRGSVRAEIGDLSGSDAEDRKRQLQTPVASHYMTQEWQHAILWYRHTMKSYFHAEISTPENDDEENIGQRLGVWPMAQFMWDNGQERLAHLKGRQQPWVDWASSSEGPDPDAFSDEYESDGIDDNEIDEHLPSDEDDDLPGHLLLDSDMSESDDGLVGSSHPDALQPARFSSDEVEESEGGDEGSSHGRDKHRGGRRIIDLESEDEDRESEKTVPLGGARGVKRRARAMLAESDDEDDESPAPSRVVKRRAHPSTSKDSENEEEDEDEDEEAASEESKSSSGESESTDDAPPPKRMSLAKRLQMEYGTNRAAHPADDSDDEGQSYGNASDDDEGDESEGGDLVSGMAEEGNEEDEEEDMDGW